MIAWETGIDECRAVRMGPRETAAARFARGVG